MHISNYIDEKFYGRGFIENDYWKNFVFGGGGGVPLFFVISGFILALPFANWRLNRNKKVVLRHYYLRRVTRLEPPYLIALIILFVAHVWLLDKYNFSSLVPHFLASSVYLHNIIYGYASTVLPVAWSLEVEVQFYILAPFFCLLFLIRLMWLRWIIYLVIIIAGSIYWYDEWKVGHVFKYLHYFFSGIMIADLYCTDRVLFKNHRIGLIIGILSLLCFLFYPSLNDPTGYYLRIASIFLLTHTILTNPYLIKIFSSKSMLIIGGMCYSIYLLHFAIVSAIGTWLISSGFQAREGYWFIPLAVLLIISVLVISAVFFILVEKPFMKPIGLGKTKEELSAFSGA